MHHLCALAALIDRAHVVHRGQVAADLNLCAVEERLVFAEDLLAGRTAAEHRVDRKVEIALRRLAHVSDAALRLIERESRRGKETRLELRKRVLLRLAGRHAPPCELDQQTGKRQEQQGAGHVEQRVEVRDAALVDRIFPEREADRVLHSVDRDQKRDRTDEVEVEVHHRGAARVLRAAERGQERGDTGTDILTEDDRDSGRIGDRARRGQRLQDTDRRRGRLDDRGDARADHNAEHRVGDRCKQIGKLRQIRERRDRALHDRHADEQDAEAGENVRDVARAALFREHHNDNAYQNDDVGEIFRLEQIHEQVARAVAAAQTQDLRGDGRTDIRAQDNADRLLERHDACVNKADHHDRRRRRGLNDHRHDHAHDKSGKDVARHFFQSFFQLGTGSALQSLSHCCHAVDEQRKTADHLYD